MKLLKLFLLFCIGFMSCTEPQRPIVVEQPVIAQQPQPEYTTHQNPHTNQQMVVFKDNNGLEQMMEYMMFMSLLNSMGDGGGCWNCVYGRRDYYRPRNEINLYRQYNVVSDRSYRYNQNGQNYNNRTNNTNNTNNKSGTATTAYGNGIENKTLTRQPNTNVGQTAQPITQQSGIQNKTLTRQVPTGMPPPIVRSPTQSVQKPTPTPTKTASPIKQVTLTRKPK